jgi:uncharacterized protein with HEPN domain
LKGDDALREDILLAAEAIAEFIVGLTEADFIASALVQSAVIRQLEVIGEAAKRLSPEFRSAHSHVPWRQVAGMRDRLIHGYDDIDLITVWEAAIRDVPHLVRMLNPS